MTQRTFQEEDIKEAFFPITHHAISWWDDMGNEHPIRGQRAIVDHERGRCLSIVTDNYYIITNEAVYSLADNVISTVFPGSTIHDFFCFNILMPKTRSFCTMDLMMRYSADFDYTIGADTSTWKPFLRITNSYNRSRAMSFTIGFCRCICTNGMIFGEKSVSFSVEHTRDKWNAFRSNIEHATHNKLGEIASIWHSFKARLEYLYTIPMPRSLVLATYCCVYDIKIKPQEIHHIQKEKYARTASYLQHIADSYFDELGNNGYAMLNVMTDLASFPLSGGNVAVVSAQKRVSLWVEAMFKERTNPDFSLSRFLGSYLDSGLYLESLVSEDQL